MPPRDRTRRPAIPSQGRVRASVDAILMAAELRPLADPDALVFVLQHALEASTHAAAFYRPEGLSAERAREAISDLVLRALLPDPRVGLP